MLINAAYPIAGNILNDGNNTQVINPNDASAAPKVQVGANDGNFELGDLGHWRLLGGNTHSTLVINNTDAYAGTYCMKFSLATDLVSNNNIVLEFPTVAGIETTVSFYAKYVGWNSGLDKIQIIDAPWSSIDNAQVAVTENLTWGSANTYARYSITFTPTSTKATLSIKIVNQGLALDCYFDNFQIEFGATPTTYVSTGPKIYGLFSGFIERYPETFQAPNRGEVNLIATDIITSMARNTMSSVYATQVINDKALYYYPLGEPNDSTAAYNSGIFQQNPLTIKTPSYAITTPVTFGEETAATGVIGSGTTGVTLFSGAGGYGTILGNFNTNDIIFSPLSPTYTFSFWFKLNDADATGISIFDAYSSDTMQESTAGWNITYSGGSHQLTATMSIPNGLLGSASVNSTSLSVGIWYYLSLTTTRNSDGSYTLTFTTEDTDGNLWTLSDTSTDLYTPNVPITNFNLGGISKTLGTSFSNLAVYRGIPDAQTYYDLGLYGLSGESTGVRLVDIVDNYSGFNNLPIIADYGLSSMQNASTNGVVLADYINTISTTESGTWYIDGDGYLVFNDRHDRLEKFIPSVTFGDGAGETPYQGGDLVINYDPTYVFNDITVSRRNGTTVEVYDQLSIKTYFPRAYSKNIDSQNDTEVTDSAYFILSRYKDPHARPETITLTPARNPSVWAVALGLEIGDLVRVKKTQLGAPQITIDCFVERVEHNFDAQTGDWVTSVSLSPAISYYWNMGSIRGVTSTTSAGNYVFNKADVSFNVRDIIPGQVMQYSISGTTYLDVVSGVPTQTSTQITVPVMRLSSFTAGLNNIKSAKLADGVRNYINTDMVTYLDMFGNIVYRFMLDTDALNDTTGYYLVDSEIIEGYVDSNRLLSVFGRALFGTTQTASGVDLDTSVVFGFTPPHKSISHLQGSTVYYLEDTGAGSLTAGTVVQEVLPNQLYSLPYTAPTDETGFNSTSVFGSWTGSLADGYITQVQYSPSLIYTNYLTMTPIVTRNNFPAADISTGQIVSVYNGTSTESMAVLQANQSSATDDTWQLAGYKVTDSGVTLNADITPHATTITFSGNVTASAILIGMEFMQVISGSGTSTLTVSRGTPDNVNVKPLTAARHFQYDKVYTIVDAGLTNTYSLYNPVIEGYNVSTPIIGTAKLGFQCQFHQHGFFPQVKLKLALISIAQLLIQVTLCWVSLLPN